MITLHNQLIIIFVSYRKFAFPFECLRCIIFFTAEQYLTPLTDPLLSHFELQHRFFIVQLLRSTFFISAILSAALGLHSVSAKISFSIRIRQYTIEKFHAN